MMDTKPHETTSFCFDQGNPSSSFCNPAKLRFGRETSPEGAAMDDAEIAKEMCELSFEERERVYDDIHGVPKVQDETPEFLSKRIKAMDEALAKIPSKKRVDYNRALFLWPRLKEATEFKLMFLRADNYDAQKAAQRLVRFYGQKRIIFGQEKLVKKISMNDLRESDLQAFKSGMMTTLPIPDRPGRPVHFIDVSKLDISRMSTESIVRCFWYLVMSEMDSEVAQRKGVSIILYFGGFDYTRPGVVKKLTDATFRTGHLTTHCMPSRFTSMHFCYDDPKFAFFVSTVRMAVASGSRLRLRTHLGSDVENEYSLMTFGVWCDGILQAARNNDTTMHLEYVRRRSEIGKQEEENEFNESTKSGFVAFPSSSDVLIGRGRPYRDFPGNQPWHQIIDSNVERYCAASSRFDKTCVSMDVVKDVRESKIRFLLELTSGGWAVLDDNKAREKVASAIQNRIKVLSRMGPSSDAISKHVAKRPRHEQSMEDNSIDK